MFLLSRFPQSIYLPRHDPIPFASHICYRFSLYPLPLTLSTYAYARLYKYDFALPFRSRMVHFRFVRA